MDKKLLLIFAIFGVILGASMITTYAVFSGTHTVNKNTSAGTAADFCIKCHPDKVTIINLPSNAHRNAGCICHGYAPNATQLYNINAAHNLTKNIYCTNCHSDYNTTTGNITIHDDGSTKISGLNQSAHYITNNTATLYDHAQQFFANSSG
ncbi:MAG: hypothetical protein PHU34_08760 [Candidatus Methanoperedens sp.]|nr:hypothetical protein [Candidatus Methanoperedens sp.]